MKKIIDKLRNDAIFYLESVGKTPVTESFHSQESHDRYYRNEARIYAQAADHLENAKRATDLAVAVAIATERSRIWAALRMLAPLVSPQTVELPLSAINDAVFPPDDAVGIQGVPKAPAEPGWSK